MHYVFNVNCALEAHVFEHLILSGLLSWETVEPLSDGALQEEVENWRQALRLSGLLPVFLTFPGLLSGEQVAATECFRHHRTTRRCLPHYDGLYLPLTCEPRNLPYLPGIWSPW